MNRSSVSSAWAAGASPSFAFVVAPVATAEPTAMALSAASRAAAAASGGSSPTAPASASSASGNAAPDPPGLAAATVARR